MYMMRESEREIRSVYFIERNVTGNVNVDRS